MNGLGNLAIEPGAIAQLGERLPCTQEVRSSILLGSTNSITFSSPLTASQSFSSTEKSRLTQGGQDLIELVNVLIAL